METTKTWNLLDPIDLREYVRWMACAGLSAFAKRDPERCAGFIQTMRESEQAAFTGRLRTNSDGAVLNVDIVVRPAEYVSDFSKMAAAELTPETETERRRMVGHMPVWFVPG